MKHLEKKREKISVVVDAEKGNQLRTDMKWNREKKDREMKNTKQSKERNGKLILESIKRVKWREGEYMRKI